MATQADVIRSVNAILQSGERKQQYEVQTALTMMQMAQQKKMQDITIAKSNLELAGKSLEQQKPQIAAQFLQSTGLGGIYQEAEEGETTGEVISDMAKRLRHKSYFGKKFDQAQAESIAGAVWSYYSAEDPNAILSVASNVYDATVMAGHPSTAKQMSPSQKRLYESFTKLGTEAEIKGVGQLASKAKQSEQYISKEISEFLQGDYDIQSPIGVYAGVPAAVEEADMDRRLKEKPPSAEYTEMQKTRESLRIAEASYKGLQNKMDTNMATDEEKEEFYELPNLMDRFRSELGDSSESLQASVQGELDDIDEKIKDMRDAGLTRTRQYEEIKRMRIEKRREYLGLTRQAAEERQREVRSSEIENISELLGVSTSEAEPVYAGVKARELARSRF